MKNVFTVEKSEKLTQSKIVRAELSINTEIFSHPVQNYYNFTDELIISLNYYFCDFKFKLVWWQKIEF